MSEAVLFSVKDSIATITLNQPEVRNAINAEIRAAMSELMPKIKYDTSIRAVILTGAGKGFSSGGDLAAMRDGISVTGGREKIRHIHEDFFWTLYRLEKPVIAAVNGAAIGAGFSLALAADFIIASKNAKFGCTFNRVGLVPDYSLLYLLPRTVGMPKAREICLTAKIYSAQEMKDCGAVLQITEPEDLLVAAEELARQTIPSAPYALGMTKRLLQDAFETPLDTMVQLEMLAQGLSYQSADHKEGVNAFFEKRPPVFTGK